MTPSDEVETALAVRENATPTSTQVGRLLPNDTARLFGEVPRWYRVTLTTGKSGFVSKNWAHLQSCATNQPAAPTFEVHAIDVGTGLSIFVRGDDFSLLYDAGSNDDLAKRENNRVLAYLAENFLDLDHIDHVVLSHPHRDHVELSLTPLATRSLDSSPKLASCIANSSLQPDYAAAQRHCADPVQPKHSVVGQLDAWRVVGVVVAGSTIPTTRSAWSRCHAIVLELVSASISTAEV